jgi:hypothetical protein
LEIGKLEPLRVRAPSNLVDPIIRNKDKILRNKAKILMKNYSQNTEVSSSSRRGRSTVTCVFGSRKAGNLKTDFMQVENKCVCPNLRRKMK